MAKLTSDVDTMGSLAMPLDDHIMNVIWSHFVNCNILRYYEDSQIVSTSGYF
jgi:hypothetical protein